jgi:hypothetical protein
MRLSKSQLEATQVDIPAEPTDRVMSALRRYGLAERDFMSRLRPSRASAPWLEGRPGHSRIAE